MHQNACVRRAPVLFFIIIHGLWWSGLEMVYQIRNPIVSSHCHDVCSNKYLLTVCALDTGQIENDKRKKGITNLNER